ncbi:MAG TPA: universal stress protein [Polyangiaceae bacterium]|jgi:nucleotide-binding universal stress UspA family protein
MTAKIPYIIVVGIDYSGVSRLALREALRTASERAASEVHAVHVDPHLASGEDESSASPAVTEALQRLHALVVEEVERFRASEPPPVGAPMRVVSHVRVGAPSKEIAQFATDLAADLAVVGTHGEKGLSRVLLGSVAHSVVTLSPCPVLVVRDKVTSYVPGIEPPCPRCLEARRQSGGRELWCDQHRARHGQRHHYYQDDRSSEEVNFPLVFHGS